MLAVEHVGPEVLGWGKGLAGHGWFDVRNCSARGRCGLLSGADFPLAMHYPSCGAEYVGGNMNGDLSLRRSRRLEAVSAGW